MIAIDTDILAKYNSLTREIEEGLARAKKIQAQIDAMQPRHEEVTDIVTKGKRGKKPLGSVKIHGFEDYAQINKKKGVLRKLKARIEDKIADVEMRAAECVEYIYSVEDSETRRMMMFYYLDKKTWAEVAQAMGEGYTADSCRVKVNREIKRKKNESVRSCSGQM